MSAEYRVPKLLPLTWAATVAATGAFAQDAQQEIPFHKRTANSPTTVVADAELADVPEFIVDPFWP